MKYPNSIIKKITTLLLTALLLIAICPKKAIHDAFAKHQHKYSIHHHCSHDYAELSENGFHCDTDNIVVDIPFTTVDVYFLPYSPTVFYDFYNCLLQQHYKNGLHGITSLRGPPVAA